MTDHRRRRVPAELAEAARRRAEGGLPPAEPKPAATVVLLRDGHGDGDGGRAGGRAAGLEVYLLRRVATMAFAARMHVFPGGTVDPRDADAAIRWAGPAPARWAEVFGADQALARALVCAAVRETFEESGVLLAGPDEDTVVADTTGDDWEADRLALIERTLPFAGFLDRRGLVLRTDLLRPWAQWVTPLVEARRYDTRFFLAAVPPGQRPRDVGGEADRVAWLPVTDAVREHHAGRLGMFPPTIATLEQLAGYPDVTAALDAAADRAVEPVMPQLVVGDDGAYVVLPGDPEFRP